MGAPDFVNNIDIFHFFCHYVRFNVIFISFMLCDLKFQAEMLQLIYKS